MFGIPGSATAITAQAMAVQGVTAVEFESDGCRGVEITITADTMLAARVAWEAIQDQRLAGIVWTFLPGGPAAEQALREALDGEIDWRLTELTPEDHDAF